MSGPYLPVRTGTLTGVVLSLILNLSPQHLLETAVLAATGGVASFLATALARRLFRKK